MTPLRQQLAEIDWERTAALTVVVGFLLFPVRWLWHVVKRRLLVPVVGDALREVLKDDLAPLKDVSACAKSLTTIVDRFERVDEDITLLFDVALGIDRRSWDERRELLRANASDRRKRAHPLNREDPVE